MNDIIRHFENLRIPLRGSRSYVHGTDVFSLFEQCLARECILRVSKLELKFSGPLTSSFDVEVSNRKTATFRASPAQMRVSDEQSEYFICAVPKESDLVKSDNNRESSLTAQVTKSGETYTIPDQSSFSTIEKIVFVNKAMLLKRIDSCSDWFFGRLRLQLFDFERDYEVGLKLNTITGKGVASSDVYLDSRIKGDIVFIPRR